MTGFACGRIVFSSNDNDLKGQHNAPGQLVGRGQELHVAAHVEVLTFVDAGRPVCVCVCVRACACGKTTFLPRVCICSPLRKAMWDVQTAPRMKAPRRCSAARSLHSDQFKRLWRRPEVTRCVIRKNN